MKKPPRAAWRLSRQRRRRCLLRSYQRCFCHQMRQDADSDMAAASQKKKAPAKKKAAAKRKAVTPKRALLGGIDLGGTKIQTVVADPNGKVLGEARRPTPEKGGPE